MRNAKHKVITIVDNKILEGFVIFEDEDKNEKTFFTLDENNEPIVLKVTNVYRIPYRMDSRRNPIYEGSIILIRHSFLKDIFIQCEMEVKYGEYQIYSPLDNTFISNVGFYVSAEGFPDIPLGNTKEYAVCVGHIACDKLELI